MTRASAAARLAMLRARRGKLIAALPATLWDSNEFQLVTLEQLALTVAIRFLTAPRRRPKKTRP